MWIISLSSFLRKLWKFSIRQLFIYVPISLECVCTLVYGKKFKIVVYNPFFTITIFHKKSLLCCLANNKIHVLRWLVMLFLRVYVIPTFQAFLFFSWNRLETIAQSTPNHFVSSSCICDGFSFNNPCKLSAFNFRGVPECNRSLTSKSPTLNYRNQYLQVLGYIFKNRANWFACFSGIFPLLKLVLYVVSNICVPFYRSSCSLILWDFTRLC